MPEISEEEYKEYIKLKINAEERKRFIKKYSAENGLEDIEEKRKHFGTVAAMASAYAKRMQRFYEKFGRRPVFSLYWKTEKKYLTEQNLQRNPSGSITIKSHLRNLLAKYGWRFKVDYNLGLLDVIKIHPK